MTDSGPNTAETLAQTLERQQSEKKFFCTEDAKALITSEAPLGELSPEQALQIYRYAASKVTPEICLNWFARYALETEETFTLAQAVDFVTSAVHTRRRHEKSQKKAQGEAKTQAELVPYDLIPTVNVCIAKLGRPLDETTGDDLLVAIGGLNDGVEVFGTFLEQLEATQASEKVEAFLDKIFETVNVLFDDINDITDNFLVKKRFDNEGFYRASFLTRRFAEVATLAEGVMMSNRPERREQMAKIIAKNYLRLIDPNIPREYFRSSGCLYPEIDIYRFWGYSIFSSERLLPALFDPINEGISEYDILSLREDSKVKPEEAFRTVLASFHMFDLAASSVKSEPEKHKYFSAWAKSYEARVLEQVPIAYQEVLRSRFTQNGNFDADPLGVIKEIGERLPDLERELLEVYVRAILDPETINEVLRNNSLPAYVAALVEKRDFSGEAFRRLKAMPAKITVSEKELFTQGVEKLDLALTRNALDTLQALIVISRAINVPIEPLIKQKYEKYLTKELLDRHYPDIEALDPQYLREVIGDPIERLADATVTIVLTHFDNFALITEIETILKDIFEANPPLKTAFLAITGASSGGIKELFLLRKVANRFTDRTELIKYAYALLNLGLLSLQEVIELVK